METQNEQINERRTESKLIQAMGEEGKWNTRMWISLSSLVGFICGRYGNIETYDSMFYLSATAAMGLYALGRYASAYGRVSGLRKDLKGGSE